MSTQEHDDHRFDGFEHDDEFEARLVAALAPAPLTAQLENRLLAEITRPVVLPFPAKRTSIAHWRPLVAGIAAAVLIAAIPRPDATQYSSEALLSRGEAAEIARTLALLTWEPPLAPAIEDTARSVERIRATLTGEGESRRDRLVGDDWDLPASISSRPGESSRAAVHPNSDA